MLVLFSFLLQHKLYVVTVLLELEMNNSCIKVTVLLEYLSGVLLRIRAQTIIALLSQSLQSHSRYRYVHHISLPYRVSLPIFH